MAPVEKQTLDTVLSSTKREQQINPEKYLRLAQHHMERGHDTQTQITDAVLSLALRLLGNIHVIER